MKAALFIDGAPATSEDLAHMALANYGAYTSFRVEQGGVRGLDLHLERLSRQAIELFGEAPAEGRFRGLMRSALDGRQDAWLRVSLFSRHITHRDASWVGEPSVMVGVFDPPPPLQGPLRVQVQAYAREAPELKHVATFGLMRARRQARAEGFDDALFVGADGVISEGSLWNIGLLEGDTVVWPQAPMLCGVAQTLIDQGLRSVGLRSQTRPVHVQDLPGFDGAFICNSATPACAVSAIDSHRYSAQPEAISRLGAAWASREAQAI
ncbi:aminotransferase class IV [Brevundimonas balnearis]|uniref:Probable branched-chain-amino-acid aminotransferase n=1 Tax=Brevundimonas balnearis TaxID=1572858 RepID=A0ABV6R132_9CAUL